MFRVFSPLLVVACLGCGQAPPVADVPLTPVVAPAEPPTATPAISTTPAADNVAEKDPAMPAENAPPAASFDKVDKTPKEWRSLLSDEEFRILRKKGTERPFTNKYDHHFEKGAYVCAACGLVLFESDAKFDSGCGWPAFYASKANDRVVLTADHTLGMVRTEVTCARCGGHLGHIFNDAPQTPTGQRYCINSVSIKFVPLEQVEKDAVVIEPKKIEENETPTTKAQP